VVLAVALVSGGTAWAVTPGGESRADRGPVAVEPTERPAPTPTPADASAWGPEDVLRANDDGSFALHPEAEVIERGRFGGSGEIFHVALGQHEYYALTMTDGSSSTQRLPAQGLGLREWANAQLALQDPDDPGSGAETDRAWVAFDAGSHLVAREGVRIGAHRPDPGFGPRFAAPGEPTAVAEVVRDGVTYFLAVRTADGRTAEAIPYRKDDRVTTLDAFLRYARQQYATNEQGGSEGLR
jgi:hypothetical protein